MSLLNEKVTADTRELLTVLRGAVRMILFTQEGCAACGPVAELAGELATLSPQLRLERCDFVADAAQAARLGVSRVPALALAREGEERAPVRYHGLPAGREFGAFLRTLILLSTGRGMTGVDAAAVAPITKATNLKVFVLAS